MLIEIRLPFFNKLRRSVLIPGRSSGAYRFSRSGFAINIEPLRGKPPFGYFHNRIIPFTNCTSKTGAVPAAAMSQSSVAVMG